MIDVGLYNPMLSPKVQPLYIPPPSLSPETFRFDRFFGTAPHRGDLPLFRLFLEKNDRSGFEAALRKLRRTSRPRRRSS